jgi:hypothetical protein
MLYWPVSQGGDLLYVEKTGLTLDQLWSFIDRGGVLIWNREGMKRKIGTSTLRQARRVYEGFDALVYAGRMPFMPVICRSISWEQGESTNAPQEGDQLFEPEAGPDAPDRARP